VSRNVVRVDIPAPKTIGWEQWFLLTSDRHHDNAHTNHALEIRHLDQAVERSAGIIDAGDLHDAMQGKWDKRSDLSQCRPEQQQGRYLDSLVDTAAKFYEPYANNWILIGRGNHEQSILKRHETDLCERTVQALNTSTGSSIQAGGYGGWVIFSIKRHGSIRHFRLKYFHGAGGGGPVSRGVIQTNRMAVYTPDADIILTGHTHDQWLVPIARERISRKGEVYLDEQVHCRAATYKDEYSDGHSGWHVERWAPPKPLGGWWIRFYCRNRRDDFRFELHRTD
jgi:hypothetical protein